MARLELNDEHLSPGDITGLLADWNAGDQDAMARILPLVYDQLRDAAARHLSGESRQLTLQPTALVNEVYIRLVENKRIPMTNRLHFFWFAGTLMRRILVDYGRRRMSSKRGNGHVAKPLDDSMDGRLGIDPALLISLDDALEKLSRLDHRQGRIVELKFFCGLSVEEMAELFQLSPTSIKRDWRVAKLWLARELKNETHGALVAD